MLSLPTPPLTPPDATSRRPSEPQVRRPQICVPEVEKDAVYWDKRSRNNASARKSREIKRSIDSINKNSVSALKQENAFLKGQLVMLKKRFGLPLDEILDDGSAESLIAVTSGDASPTNENPASTPTPCDAVSKVPKPKRRKVDKKISNPHVVQNLPQLPHPAFYNTTNNFLPWQTNNVNNYNQTQLQGSHKQWHSPTVFPSNNHTNDLLSYNLLPTDLTMNKPRQDDCQNTNVTHKSNFISRQKLNHNNSGDSVVDLSNTTQNPNHASPPNSRNSPQFPVSPVTPIAPQSKVSPDSTHARQYDQHQNSSPEIARFNPIGQSQDRKENVELKTRIQELSAEVELMKGVVFK